MTQLTSPSTTDFDRTTTLVPVDGQRGEFMVDDGWLVGSFEIANSAGGLAVEHGCITRLAGTFVAESFQTRLTVGR